MVESRKEATVYRRRNPFGLVLMVGFGVLLGAAIFGSSEAVGGLVAAPLLVLGVMFKVFLFILLFGLGAKLFFKAGARGQSGGSSPWWSDESGFRRHGRSERQGDGDRNPRADRFEEWHRMAHARQEVDDHTPPVEE